VAGTDTVSIGLLHQWVSSANIQVVTGFTHMVDQTDTQIGETPETVIQANARDGTVTPSKGMPGMVMK
jgi:hypothetical protein